MSETETTINIESEILLFCCQKSGDDYVAYAKKLIDNGADLNVKDTDDLTPLAKATYCHNVEMAKMLIERGADVNANCGGGRTALGFACFRGCRYNDITFAKMLVEAGADVNVKCALFFMTGTPLDGAYDIKNFKLMKYLIDNGAVSKGELEDLEEENK